MSKYKSKKVTVDGYTFDSKVEAKYYEKLKDDKAKGLIQNFELQPKYVLLDRFTFDGKTYREIIYKADFLVYHNDGIVEEVIDIKGMATPEAKLKRKMFANKFRPLYKLTWLCWYKNEWVEYDEAQKLKRAKKSKGDK